MEKFEQYVACDVNELVEFVYHQTIKSVENHQADAIVDIAIFLKMADGATKTWILRENGTNLDLTFEDCLTIWKHFTMIDILKTGENWVFTCLHVQ